MSKLQKIGNLLGGLDKTTATVEIAGTAAVISSRTSLPAKLAGVLVASAASHRDMAEHDGTVVSNPNHLAIDLMQTGLLLGRLGGRASYASLLVSGVGAALSFGKIAAETHQQHSAQMSEYAQTHPTVLVPTQSRAMQVLTSLYR